MAQSIQFSLALLGLASLGLAACGDDDDGGGARPNRPAVPAAAAQPAAAKTPLTEKVHIEDRVGCPIPDRPSDPKNGKCDLKAPSCSEHLYCLPLPQGRFCG